MQNNKNYTIEIAEEWRCRYKTGKCIYPRAIKKNKKNGNDAILLLCERHRRLQNHTKKKSDTKYKNNRAILRVIKRLIPDIKPIENQIKTNHYTIKKFSTIELDILTYYLFE